MNAHKNIAIKRRALFLLFNLWINHVGVSQIKAEGQVSRLEQVSQMRSRHEHLIILPKVAAPCHLRQDVAHIEAGFSATTSCIDKRTYLCSERTLARSKNDHP